MNRSLLTGLLVGAVVLTAGAAFAGYQMNKDSAYAEVTNVKPITETVSTPRQVCSEELVTRQEPVKDEKRITGTVIGAVVGGVLGNQVGGGDGKKIATAAGAAAGGYAGNQVQKNMQENNTSTQAETKCRTVYDRHDETVGYNVTYRIGKDNATVRMDHDPGSRIPVKDGALVLNESGARS
jgi:uncharacterized protein YcfJ